MTHIECMDSFQNLILLYVAFHIVHYKFVVCRNLCMRSSYVCTCAGNTYSFVKVKITWKLLFVCSIINRHTFLLYNFYRNILSTSIVNATFSPNIIYLSCAIIYVIELYMHVYWKTHCTKIIVCVFYNKSPYFFTSESSTKNIHKSS